MVPKVGPTLGATIGIAHTLTRARRASVPPAPLAAFGPEGALTDARRWAAMSGNGLEVRTCCLPAGQRPGQRIQAAIASVLCEVHRTSPLTASRELIFATTLVPSSATTIWVFGWWWPQPLLMPRPLGASMARRGTKASRTKHRTGSKAPYRRGDRSAREHLMCRQEGRGW